MSDQHLTAAARRALQAVHESLQHSPETSDPAWILIQILSREEGRAAEILNAAGISENLLTATAEPVDHHFEFPLTEWQQRLVRRADQLAIQFSPGRETGSEHLLAAVVEQHTLLADQLLTGGLQLATILEAISEPEPDLSVSSETQIQLRPAKTGFVEETALARILDAAANRCREGLRTVEDYVRFQLNAELLSRELKELRHELTGLLARLGQPRWVASRDTEHDVGTRGELASERYRGQLIDVLRAGMKRSEEALRSLEEYGKLIDADLAHRISRCRYRFYTVEKSIETTIAARERLQNCHLYLLVTASQSRYAPEILIPNSLAAGVDVVQIREKSLSDRQLIDFAKKVREWTRNAGALLIINDRPDIASVVGADGVHLGQDDLSVAEARSLLGSRGLIGVSTHHREQVRQAVFDGADYLGVGPVFPSSTKHFDQLAGLDYVREVAGTVALPWFAIGGITPANLREVQQAGATRIAVSSVICQAAHPRGVATDLKQQLQSAATNVPRSG